MLALALIVAVPAIAQTQSTSTDMQVLANEVKADKKALVAQNMELTATEAESFWPIYDAYQQDLQKINNSMTQTILEYADAYSKGTVDNATAKKLLGEALAIQESELKLQQTYVPKLEKVLPEVKVARYIQIESKIRALVRYVLASKIPLAE
jgi:Spy/CpxP family protein refolding chaperone